MFLSKGNKKYAFKRIRAFTFGIPAWRAADGRHTCPCAKDCVKGCYAQQGRYVFNQIKNKQEERLALTLRLEFTKVISKELDQLRPDLVRVHDSGDFYNVTYLRRWLEVMRNYPRVAFLAYTKMVPLFKREDVQVPVNFCVIFSEGGTHDHLIDRGRDRWARIFPSVKALRQAGFVDCHESDLPALDPDARRIGLVYHGWKSRTFDTVEVKA